MAKPSSLGVSQGFLVTGSFACWAEEVCFASVTLCLVLPKPYQNVAKTSGCNQGMMIGHANHDASLTGIMSAH